MGNQTVQGVDHAPVVTRNSLFYKDKFVIWLWKFLSSHVFCLHESNFNAMTRKCFVLDWSECRTLLAPDMEGSVLASLIYANSKLGLNSAQQKYDEPMIEMQIKKLEDLAGLQLKPEHENTAILLEIMKYSGKEVNLVEAFELFSECHLKSVEYKVS